MNHLFTSESVSEGHPDKVADQISDAILDEFLRQDPEAKVACETFCTSGLVVVGGEVASERAYVDIPATVRRVIARIGYTKAELEQLSSRIAACQIVKRICQWAIWEIKERIIEYLQSMSTYSYFSDTE